MTGCRIAYVVSRWGEPTQTFVRREAEAVAALGADVVAVSLRRPGPAPSPLPVVRASWPRLVGGVARMAVMRPLVTGRLLLTVVRRSAVGNVGPQLVAALIGVGWAGSGMVAGRSLHAHFGWVASTSAWAAAATSGQPYTVVLHAFELHSRRYQDRFVPIPLRAAAQVFVISERDRALVRERWGLDAAVLRMGAPEEWLASEPAPAPEPLVVSVGSLVPKKGHDVLLRAIAAGPVRWRLEVIGAGPQEAALVALAEELGLRDRVRFTGLLDEQHVRDHVRSAWVVALAAVEDTTGDRDGIPVALMEAMALGVPVISTDAGAIPELVAGAGVVVPSGDVDALTHALADLADHATRARWAQAGRARVRESWTVRASAGQVLDVHRRLRG